LQLLYLLIAAKNLLVPIDVGFRDIKGVHPQAGECIHHPLSMLYPRPCFSMHITCINAVSSQSA
jgi:hypothetical protein